MDSTPSDLPIVELKNRPPSWFSVWVRIVTSPKEQTFVDIMDHPDARQNTAFIWVLVAGLLPIIIIGSVQAMLVATGSDEQIVADNIDDANKLVSGIGVFVTYLCISPVVAALIVGSFGLAVGCVQWLARVMGGTGSYEKLVYVLGAISVPVLIVSPIAVVLALVLIFEHVLLVWIIGIVEFLMVVYTLILQAMAVKAVNHLWWSEAIGLALLSGVGILVLFGCCLFFGIFGAV